jgi:sulfite reductase beta subunit-like hemoprotein
MGQMVDAYFVLVGAKLGRDPQFAFEIVAGEGPKGRIKIPEELLPAAIMRLVETYRSERGDGDRFGDWARRQPMPRLAGLVVPPELAGTAVEA